MDRVDLEKASETPPTVHLPGAVVTLVDPAAHAALLQQGRSAQRRARLRRVARFFAPVFLVFNDVYMFVSRHAFYILTVSNTITRSSCCVDKNYV